MNRTGMESLPEVMSITEAAQYLGIGRNSAYEAARRNEIPSVRIGNRILVPKQALAAMMCSCVAGRAA